MNEENKTLIDAIRSGEVDLRENDEMTQQIINNGYTFVQDCVTNLGGTDSLTKLWFNKSVENFGVKDMDIKTKIEYVKDMAGMDELLKDIINDTNGEFADFYFHAGMMLQIIADYSIKRGIMR